MADQTKNQNENAEKYESFHADGLFLACGRLRAGGSYVKISSLSSDYYASRYVGARRIV